jgi:alpha-galactosidase
MTIALPPENTDRLWGGQNSHTTAELDFQARLLLFSRPTVAIFSPPNATVNPLLLARLQHLVQLYKTFVRPFVADSCIYHHTPTFVGLEPQGWGVLELAAADHSRAIAGVFQLASPVTPEYTLRLRGLDDSRRYRVTLDNLQQSFELDGQALSQAGLTVRLEGALTSELILFEAL